jgi:phosphonate ABC transporter permease subunit PhnE
VILLILGGLGIQIGGRLYKWATNNLGDLGALILNIISILPVAAIVGYVLGTSYSKGIRMIVLGPEVAAINETLYGYIGAGLVALLGLVLALRIKPKGEIKVGMILYSVTRTLMNIIRSIEPIIYAIVATIWVGLGPFAGTIALTLHTIAALGKLYSESIESIDPGPIEALQATGANRLQTIIYAVVPQILPPFISFTIYRWDINVRMSTIIGAVGGGGIGFILIQWIRIFNYRSAGLAVWLIAITVSTLDYVSSNIRKRYV